MDYVDAREYLKTLEQRGSVLGLESMTGLMELLGNIQDRMSVIHVAGTNGKGSVSSYIAAGFRESGFLVGTYHSPAVFSELETISVNGIEIRPEEYAGLMEKIKDTEQTLKRTKGLEVTAFEAETAMAFLYFFEKQCDYVIMETGMGGRLDATNILKKPICSVITSISMDHMGFLGNTIEKIAGEKAGIIKEGCPVFTAVQQEAVTKVLQTAAKQKHSPFVQAGVPEGVLCSRFGTTIDYQTASGIKLEQVHTDNIGTFQAENLALALEVLASFEILDWESIKRGIGKARWHGRFQKIHTAPDLYIDGGHNPAAAKQIRKTLEQSFQNVKIIFVMGVFKDKDYEGILRELQGAADIVYTITPNHPRGLQGEILKQAAKPYFQTVIHCDTIEEGVQLAMEAAGPQGMVLAMGSLSILRDVERAVFYETPMSCKL